MSTTRSARRRKQSPAIEYHTLERRCLLASVGPQQGPLPLDNEAGSNQIEFQSREGNSTHLDLSGETGPVTVDILGYSAADGGWSLFVENTGEFYSGILTLTGTSDPGDQLNGIQEIYEDVMWNFHPDGSEYVLESYSSGEVSLEFHSFERLIGGMYGDIYTVTPPTEAPIYIDSGDMSQPGPENSDHLKIVLPRDVTSPEWHYVRKQEGRFSFGNRMDVVYGDMDILDNFDYGDAPRSYDSLSDPVRHRLSAQVWRLFMGTAFDYENRPTGNVFATADDNNGLAQDEDGVVLPPALVRNQRATAIVTASGAAGNLGAKVDAWVDFDGDGTFSEAERIADSFRVSAGENRIEFLTPNWARKDIRTYARFRISRAGNLDPIGEARDGEVEDHRVWIRSAAPGGIGIFPDPMSPENPEQRVLAIGGTSADDNFTVIELSDGRLETRVNSVVYRPDPAQWQIARIVAHGLQGRDTIELDNNVTQAAEIFGNWGPDRIKGGSGNDFLQGDNGNDRILGGPGNDIISGNSGNDVLFGGNDNDLLVGSTGNDISYGGTGLDSIFAGAGADLSYGDSGSDLLVASPWNHEGDNLALVAVHREWTSGVSYNARSGHLRQGTGNFLGGTGWRLSPGTLPDDGTPEDVFGGDGRDMFFGIFASDALSDLEANEYNY